MHELREAWQRREARIDRRFGVIAAAAHNAMRVKGTPARPEDFFPGIRAVMAASAPSDDEFDKRIESAARAAGSDAA